MSITHKIHRINEMVLPKHLFYGPEWLVLGVNNVCNLHCKMCDVGNGNTDTNFAQNLTGTKPLNMPWELISKILEEAAHYYPQTKIGYAFTEPLVYPHLMESLELASAKGLYTALTTNALTLPQKAADLGRCGLNEINISLDGTQEVHNYIRGNKQSFQKAVEGIEKLLTLSSRPDISVFCVITEWNIENMLEFVTFFNQYPLKQIGFMHTNFTPDWLALEHNKVYGHTYPATLSNTDEIDLTKMDLEQLWKQMEAIHQTRWNFPVSFSPNLRSKEQLMTFYHQPEKKIGKRCNDVFRNVMIKSDGSVIPAHGRCYNLTIGNIYQSTLPEIWNSSVIAEFRKTINKAGGLLPACTRCCSAF